MSKINDTIKYYNNNASKYFETTIKGNMDTSYSYFLEFIPSGGYILDYGCGSGRDTKYFIDKGYKVDAIDGSEELCKLASLYTGIDVKCMDFMDLNENNKYDGIWACSSIIHVPKESLIMVLKKMSNALKNNGYIYASFKDGIGEEVDSGRYFNYVNNSLFNKLLEQFPELELMHQYANISTTNSKESRNWNNYILKKKA